MTNPYEKYVKEEENPYAQFTVEKKTLFGRKPMTKEQAGMFNEVMGSGGWGTGVPKEIYEAGGKVTDVTGSPVAGAATNFLLNAIPSFLTSATVKGPQASFPGADWASRRLMQGSIKPSISQNSPADISSAVRTMLDKNIYGSPSGMDKAMNLSRELDDEVGQLLSNSSKTVKVSAILDRVRDVLRRAERQFVPQQDVAAVEKAWTDALQNPLLQGKSEIPVALAHELKKGTYHSLGNKVYGEVGSASVEAQKAMARGARQEVAAAEPMVKGPLAEQASLQNVLTVAGPKAAASGNLNPIGIAGLGAANPKVMALMLADRWAWLKEALAMQLYHGAKPSALAPLGMAVNAPEDIKEVPETLRGLY